jgi:hypothetical protein
MNKKAHEEIKQNIYQVADRVPLDIRGGLCWSRSASESGSGGRDGGRGKSEKSYRK